MGLKETLQALASTAFDVIGNIPTSVTYTSKTGNPSYTAGSGAISDPDTDYSVSMLLASYAQEEVDNNSIRRTDLQAFIPTADLTPTPKLNDTVTIDSVVWKIINISKDPADALWELQLRKS